MQVDSKEYRDLMNKWSNDAWNEEISIAKETYLEAADYLKPEQITIEEK